MTRKLIFTFGACLFLIAGKYAISAEPGTNAVKGRNPRSQFSPRAGAAALGSLAQSVQRDVVYGKGGETELKMDIYHPKTTAERSLPVAVYVHGGGWSKGDKGQGAGLLAFSELLRRGYLVCSIDYRLAPQFKFPAHIEDAKCAIRFLRAHAKEYNLDTNRIGVFGGSAGGHIVALMGTADRTAQLEGQGGWSDQSSRVQAVVDMFGPTDLFSHFGNNGSRIGSEVFGAASADDPVLKRASPVTYVSADDPPFLILHGDQDRTVPLEHSEKLNQKLKAAGVSSTLVVVKNAGHGFAPAGGEPTPGREELARMIADFFDKNLRRQEPVEKSAR